MTAKKIIVIAAICALAIVIWLVFFFPDNEVKYQFQYLSDKALQEKLASYKPVYPDCSFMVISDLHLYDPVLGTSGQAFETYLDEDRKLLRESPEIMDAAVTRISSSAAQFILVPGDLTKDGEKLCHLMAKNAFERIEASGKQIFVAPGNHDINNSDSFKFTATGKEKTDTIQASDFASIYDSFGYSGAIERDPDSLSYLAEPVPGLWLLALDACRYMENREGEKPIVAGRFRQKTVTWAEKILERAVFEKKAVFAFMHHGIVEHFSGQNDSFWEYLVAGYRQIADMFAAYKVRCVFTGHYHAQDITLHKNENSSFLFDIETGSLVTYPSPIRSIFIKDNTMTVDSYFISSIPSHPEGFPEFSKKYVHEGIARISITAMKKYWVPDEDANRLAPQVADAFVAHYSGVEIPPGATVQDRALIDDSNLSFIGWLVINQRKSLVISLWHDLPPSDNKLTINLSSGEYK